MHHALHSIEHMLAQDWTLWCETNCHMGEEMHADDQNFTDLLEACGNTWEVRANARIHRLPVVRSNLAGDPCIDPRHLGLQRRMAAMTIC